MSEVMPNIESMHDGDAEIIKWADANPVAWKIVTTKKSKPYGVGSSTYFGCIQRGGDASSVLGRLAKFYDDVHNNGVPAHTSEPFWQWRAKFTLEHFKDKGFKGGFFKLFDGQYDRNCAYLDYTPETREAVIDRFLEWCDPYYTKHSVKIDNSVVRVMRKRGK